MPPESVYTWGKIDVVDQAIQILCQAKWIGRIVSCDKIFHAQRDIQRHNKHLPTFLSFPLFFSPILLFYIPEDELQGFLDLLLILAF